MMSRAWRRSCPTVAGLIDLFRAKGWPIIHTREATCPTSPTARPPSACAATPPLRIGDPGPMGRLLVRGEPGNADHRRAGAACRARSSSTSPARARSTRPASTRCCAERGITHLVFAGVTTEVCVQTTMREANDRGFECLLIEDATESYFPEFKAATLAMITAQGGIVGWATPLATLKKAVGL